MSEISLIFATMNNMEWSENVIVADADYIDKVAFDLTVNFERMIGRRIPPADLARWIDCVALDGGVREGEQQTQVVLIHDKRRDRLQYFIPGSYAGELHGQAFRDNLGEFSLSAYPVEEMVTKADFLTDVLQTVCAQSEVKRVMVIADVEQAGVLDSIRAVLRPIDDEKRITVFAMAPIAGGNYRQEILGYSLMAALGISADEINSKTK